MNNSYLAVYARRCEQMGADWTPGICTDLLGLLGDAGKKVRCDDYEEAVRVFRAGKAARSDAPPSQPGTVRNWIDKVSANQLMVAATLLTVGATIYVSRRNR